MTSFDSGSNVGIGKEGIDARVRCSPASRLIGRSSECPGSSRGPAPRARASERRPNGAQRSHLRRGPRGNKNGFGFCAGSDSRSPPRAVSLKWWPAPCVALCASPRSTRRFRPPTTRQARLLMSAHATVAGCQTYPTDRERLRCGVYGRLKIFEFRVVGLFTQPAANENPYPMKGLLAIATRFPRLNRLGSVRRVNWSSRLALQTFETAEPTLTQVLSSSSRVCLSQTKRTPPHPVARIMGWFGTDDTPADAGSPVDKDTYVVTYCRN